MPVPLHLIGYMPVHVPGPTIFKVDLGLLIGLGERAMVSSSHRCYWGLFQLFNIDLLGPTHFFSSCWWDFFFLFHGSNWNLGLLFLMSIPKTLAEGVVKIVCCVHNA